MSSIRSKLSLTLSYAVLLAGGFALNVVFHIQLPPDLAKGGHIQFLTNLAMIVTLFYFSLNAVHQLFEISSLAYARQFINSMAISVEFIVSFVYWGLRLVSRDLILKGPGVPLWLDLLIHAMPFASLLTDYFFFMDPWTVSKKEALVTTFLLANGYWFLLDRVVPAEGRFPYPFLDVDNFHRAIIFSVPPLDAKFLALIDNPANVQSESTHYSSLHPDNWPIDLSQYHDQYVVRVHADTKQQLDGLLLAAHEQNVSIWESSRTKLFIDLLVSRDSGSQYLQTIQTRLPGSSLDLSLVVHDLPQAVFETFPAADDLDEEQDNDITVQTELFFKRYRDLNTIYQWFDLLVDTYPDLLTVEWIGQTFEGRDIKALRLTAHKDNPSVTEPLKTLVITSGIHAREWISVSTSCYILFKLLQDFDSGKKKAKKFLNNMDFLFLPVMNPDGYEHTWSSDRLWRKNKQETYNAACFGIDIDHSFNFHFTRSDESPCGEDYPGEGAFESLESNAWDNYLNQTKHDHPIYGYIDLHSYAEEILYPYAFTCSETPRDEENLIELAYGLSQSIRLSTGKSYTVLSACEDKGSDLLPSMGAGSALDYMYHNKAYWAFVLKLRDTGSHGFLLPPKYIVPVGKEIYSSIKSSSSWAIQSIEPCVNLDWSLDQNEGYLDGSQVSRWASKWITATFPYTLWRARRWGSKMEWSPPRATSLGGPVPSTAFLRLSSSSSNACVIWSSASLLSIGDTGMSPQSSTLAQFWYGLMPALVVAVSNGTPMTPMSKSSSGLSRHLVWFRWANVWTPVKGHSSPHSWSKVGSELETNLSGSWNEDAEAMAAMAERATESFITKMV
ncbi:hypothetical protein OGAPHI_000932 [Ogataea philodendri]|uniref:Inactive metallocarboxypeptidase ECM14 n=1 Tax=Ogataea philodendri TaxID=1378263 RepID=A0A9P8PEK1_9ASCO|nr:uncharacterized protein OGAPHI_000932 [Ogataea philodendri]KAH3670417.1 hypothetical protein OGAPHI_000932 [Ogataea philodendri]